MLWELSGERVKWEWVQKLSHVHLRISQMVQDRATVTIIY